MRVSFILSALVLPFAASTLAQAVKEGIAPDQPPPKGCKTTVESNFTIGIATIAKHKRETAQEASGAAVAVTLTDGILRDSYNRTGSIVANYQFQFDGPPQAGAIYTGGFSVCENGSLALGGSTVWYRCMSGAFGNLYDRSIGDQCSEVRIVAIFPKKEGESASTVVGTALSTGTALSLSSAPRVSSTRTDLTQITGTNPTRTVIPTSTPTNKASATSGSGQSSKTPPQAPPAKETGAAGLTIGVEGREKLGMLVGIAGALWML